MRCLSAGRCARAAHGARRASAAWSASGPDAASSASQRARTLVGRSGPQLEVRQRGAQVEPGAADDDRRARRRRAARRSRRAPAAAYCADGEVASTGTNETSRCSRRARSAARGDPRERLEAAVDLQRVGRDRDRVPAAPPQPVGDARARPSVLPTPVGPKSASTPRAARGIPAASGGSIVAREASRHARRAVSARVSAAHRLRPVDGPRRADRLRSRPAPTRVRRSTARAPTSSSCSPPARTSRRPRRRSRASHEALAPAALIGCGAGGVLGAGREIEARHRGHGLGRGVRRRRPAPRPFHAVARSRSTRHRRRTGCPSPAGAAALSCSPTPIPSRPTARSRELAAAAPGVPVLGGISSARTLDGGAALFRDDAVAQGAPSASVLRRRGAPAVRLPGRGADRPRADGHRGRRARHPRARRPPGARGAAARRSRSLDQDERDARRAAGCCSASHRRRQRPSTRRATTSCGASSAPTPSAARSPSARRVREGQVVRLHARDAASADRDLRDCLELRREALGGERRRARSSSPATGAAARCSASPTTTPTSSTRSSAARRRRVLRRGRDRPRRRRELPARLHRDGRGLRAAERCASGRDAPASSAAMIVAGQHRPGHRRHRRHRPCDRARACAPAGAQRRR